MSEFSNGWKPSPYMKGYIQDMKDKYMTSRTAAEAYGFTLGRLNQIAKERGIEPLTMGGIHLWTAQQVKELKPKSIGRPRGTTNRKVKK